MGSRSLCSIKCERDFWNYFHGKGRRHEARRGNLNKKFKAMVQKGLTARNATYWLSENKKRRGNVHPESYAFLLRFGTEYKEPKSWSAPPQWGEPARKRCFSNSAALVRTHARYLERHPRLGKAAKSAFVYVEGIAFGPMVNPMAHAWNAYGAKGKKAVDWTFYAVSHRTTYLGLMLTSEEYEELCECAYPWLKLGLRKQPGYKRSHRVHHIQIFGIEYFGRIEFRLLLRNILERRKKAGKKKPL